MMELVKFARLAFFWVFCLAVVVDAAPIVDHSKRDAVDPPIISPDKTTVWVIGTQQTVTWNTSVFQGSPPSSFNGQVLLGFLNDTSGNEHLNITNPLADGFNITTGSVNITVPDVPPGNDYIIALLGDSGNISPTFTIAKSSNTSTTSTTSTITTSSSSSSSTISTTEITSVNSASTIVFESSRGTQAGGSTPTSVSVASTTGTGTAVAQSSLPDTNAASARPVVNAGAMVIALVAVFALL